MAGEGEAVDEGGGDGPAVPGQRSLWDRATHWVAHVRTRYQQGVWSDGRLVGLGTVVAAVIVLAIVAGVNALSDDPGPAAAPSPAPAATATTEIEDLPTDNCAADFLRILLPAVTVPVADYERIVTVYGTSDQRTQVLITLAADYETGRYNDGEISASNALGRSIRTWCDDNAEDFGY